MNDKLDPFAFFGRQTKLEFKLSLDMILGDIYCSKMEINSSFMGIFSMIFEVRLLCTNSNAYNIVLKTYFCELQMVDYLLFFLNVFSPPGVGGNYLINRFHGATL